MNFKLILFSTFILTSIKIFPQFQDYHSIAEIDSRFRATISRLELIQWPEGNKNTFGILVGIDKTSVSINEFGYILFAPTTGWTFAEDIDDLELKYSAPIKTEELEYFVNELGSILNSWGKEKSDTKGSFFEFLTAPDYRIRIISESAEEWQPTIKFSFQDFSGETIAVLYIGPKSFSFRYEFDDVEELEVFYNMLSKALDKLTKK